MLTSALTLLPRRSAERRTLSLRASYALIAAIIGLALFAAGVPSPLYGTYAELWSLSPLVLTLVYATYAFGVLATLLIAGRLSDDTGRRPVLLVALGTLMGATVLFALAGSVAWLFVARGLQGLATGLVLSAASAALFEFHPRRDPAGVSLANGVAGTAGLGLGVLVSSALVELLPAPRVLPFVMLTVLFAIALAGVWRMPEPAAARRRVRLTIERPYVPQAIRAPFALAALGAVASWSIAGLFLSLGPQVSAELFHTTNHLIAGIGVFALSGSAAAAQVAFSRTPPWEGAAGGSLGLSAGMVLIVTASATDSASLFLAGAATGGAGFGVASLGALRALTPVIPGEHRAAVLSAYYLVSYGALSVPAVVSGLVVERLGLQTTFQIFGGAAAALSLVAALYAAHARPRTPSRTQRRRRLAYEPTM